jgi:sortase B
MLAVSFVSYRRNRRLYEQARVLAVGTPAVTMAEAVPADTAVPFATPEPPEETPPITVDFSAIHEEGKHVRGWLYCADTPINYPVVYYSNNTYYLTHDYTGKRSDAGALFFDTRQTKELTGDCIIIFGHHMKDRSMFGSLPQYQKQDYYDAHPTMYLITENDRYRIDLFAGRFTDSDAQNFPVWFTSEQARRQFIQTAIANSDFIPLDTQDRAETQIISLVTCAYSQYIEDAKYQVLGWLVEIR